MIGNQWGTDPRLHVRREGDRNLFVIGVQPAVRLVWDDHGTEGLERIRTFSGFGVLVPEVGLQIDNQGELGTQLQFVEPVSVMLNPSAALDFRFSGGFQLFGGRTGAVATLGLGVPFR